MQILSVFYFQYRFFFDIVLVSLRIIVTFAAEFLKPKLCLRETYSQSEYY